MRDIEHMIDRSESVHVHRGDARQVIKEYRLKGFVLKERTKPTVVAQDGFIRLVFIPAEEAVVSVPPQPTDEKPKRRRTFLFWKLNF